MSDNEPIPDADLDDLLSEIDLNEDPSQPPTRGRRALSAVANDTNRLPAAASSASGVTRTTSSNGLSNGNGTNALPTSSSAASQLRRQKSKGRVTSGRGTATEAESSGGEFAFSIRAAPAGKGQRARPSPLPAPPAVYESHNGNGTDIPMATLAPHHATSANLSVIAATLAAGHDHDSEYEQASRNADNGQRQRDVAEALHRDAHAPSSSSTNNNNHAASLTSVVIAAELPSPPLSPPTDEHGDRERRPMIAMGVIAPPSAMNFTDVPTGGLFQSHEQERAAARAARRSALKKKRRGASQGSVMIRQGIQDSSGLQVTNGGTRRTVHERLIEVSTSCSCYDLIGDWTDTRRRVCMHICTICIFTAALAMFIMPFTVAETRFASPFLYAASTIIGVMALFGAGAAIYGTHHQNLSMLCGWITLGGITWSLALVEGIVGMLEDVLDLREAVSRYWKTASGTEKAKWGEMSILLARAESNVHAIGVCAITTAVVMFVALLVHHTLRSHWLEEIAADAAERSARHQLEIRRHERSVAAIDAVHGGHIGMFDTTATATTTDVTLNEHDMRGVDEQL